MEYEIKTKIWIEDNEFKDHPKGDVIDGISDKFAQVWENDHKEILQSVHEIIHEQGRPDDPITDEDKEYQKALLRKY